MIFVNLIIKKKIQSKKKNKKKQKETKSISDHVFLKYFRKYKILEK